jgi:predicted ABC-type ATPase
MRIRDDALSYARKHKKAIARRLTDPSIYPPVEEPVSVFMAGSPGAGKTEVSLELIDMFSDDGIDVLRIDPDELRYEFEEYQGGNSWLFQPAVSILVEKIHDIALKQRQNFILDGTLSQYRKSRQNIDRSLKYGRTVQILYVYQQPQLAWEFVQAREKQEGRKIRPETFLEQYFAAREVVNRLKAELGRQIASPSSA